MNSWLQKLVVLVCLLLKWARGLPRLPAASAYPWDTCSECRAPLRGRVHRLLDASYCGPCHDSAVAALD